MEALQFLTKVETENANIAEIRSKLLNAVKVQLIPSAEGYDTPKAHGIYRDTGGECLGVVGEQFVPANLDIFLNSIIESIYDTKLVELDISKLTYHEYASGRKIAFRLPVKDFTVGRPEKGDVTKCNLSFRTGFDGLTKFTITSDSYRIWCNNGAGSWERETVLSCKNTASAQDKVLTFADKIIREIEHVESYQTFLNDLLKIDVSPEDIEAFKAKLFNKEQDEFQEIRDESKGLFYNNLLKLDSDIDIETQYAGNNLYSVLQGITRYTTHRIAKGNFDKIHFNSSASRLNSRAHEIILEMI